MKPTRLLLIWLGLLLGLNTLLGASVALQVKVPETLHSVAWGLLLALLPGPMWLAYAIGWVIMPDADGQ